MFQRGGGGGGSNCFNIAVQQNQMDFDAYVEAVYWGLYMYSEVGSKDPLIKAHY